MRFLHRLPLRIVLTVVTHPRLTLAISAVLLAACVLLGVYRLPISTDQNKLFSSDVPFFRDFLEFGKKFPENEAVYVILEPTDPAHPPALERWTDAADAVAGRLRKSTQFVHSAIAGVPVDQLGNQGLLFEDSAALPQRLAEVRRFVPLVQLWAEPPNFLTARLGNAPLERFLAGLRWKQALTPAGAASDEFTPFIAMLAKSWKTALTDPQAPLRPGAALPDLGRLGAESPRDLGYSYVPDESDPTRRRQLLLIQVYPRENHASLTAVSEAVEAIRAATREAMQSYPDLKAGITGRPALEADEMSTTDRDSNRAEIIALAAVFVGLVVVFRSIWLAVAAEICLGVGIGWTFGWASLTVGELNLLSIVFLIALIGIGMDYLVQVLSRYRREIGRRENQRAVWVAVFRQVAAPITTACLGAAGAFLVSALTQFRGAADLGIIAGGGLLLCLVAGYTVLPALLTLFPIRRRLRAAKESSVQRIAAELKGRALPARGRWKLLAPAGWMVLLLAGIPFALRSHFDPGLINLQAPNLESVQLVHKLQTWSAVVLSKDLDVLRRARAAVRDSTVVASTESILTAYDNADLLASRASALPAIQWTEPLAIRPAELVSIAEKARTLATQIEAGPTPQTRPTANDGAVALRGFAQRLDAEIAAGNVERAANRLSAWQTAFIGQLRQMLSQFNPGPPRVDQLPVELRTHLIADDGTYALYLYPREDLWPRESLDRFVTEIESRLGKVAGVPAPTGIAIDLFHSTQAVRSAFLHATGYALALILLIVLLDMRKIGDTLLAVSVLALGLPMLVSLMGLLGVSWNFANFFGLPILIGAGHEYGVFMVHRYREAVADPRRRGWHGWDASDGALLLCGYVTSASFGFFWLMGHHRGLKSLGLVMALGTACIYLATVAVLRPILKWRLARRATQAG